jgi:hypothetical protein
MSLYPARVSYQWKIPGAKSHHGYAMGVVESDQKNEEGVIKALKQKHANLQPYEIIIIKLEWR